MPAVRTYEEILARLVREFQEITGYDWIGPDTKLGEIIDVDSLGVVELVMHIEETLRCDLDDDVFQSDRSVSTIALRIFDALR